MNDRISVPCSDEHMKQSFQNYTNFKVFQTSHQGDTPVALTAPFITHGEQSAYTTVHSTRLYALLTELETLKAFLLIGAETVSYSGTRNPAYIALLTSNLGSPKTDTHLVLDTKLTAHLLNSGGDKEYYALRGTNTYRKIILEIAHRPSAGHARNLAGRVSDLSNGSRPNEHIYTRTGTSYTHTERYRWSPFTRDEPYGRPTWSVPDIDKLLITSQDERAIWPRSRQQARSSSTRFGSGGRYKTLRRKNSRAAISTRGRKSLGSRLWGGPRRLFPNRGADRAHRNDRGARSKLHGERSI